VAGDKVYAVVGALRELLGVKQSSPGENAARAALPRTCAYVGAIGEQIKVLKAEQQAASQQRVALAAAAAQTHKATAAVAAKATAVAAAEAAAAAAQAAEAAAAAQSASEEEGRRLEAALQCATNAALDDGDGKGHQYSQHEAEEGEVGAGTCDTLAHSVTLTLSHTLSRCHSLTHSLTNSLSLAHTRTQTHHVMQARTP
jgi:hypothetical protein